MSASEVSSTQFWALASLSTRFDDLMALWHDDVGRTFRHGCWEPVLRASQSLEQAMETLGEVAQQARSQVP